MMRRVEQEHEHGSLQSRDQETEHIQMQTNATQKVALINRRKHSHKNYAKKTDRAWFGRVLRHPARKRSESVLSIPDPERGETLNTGK